MRRLVMLTLLGFSLATGAVIAANQTVKKSPVATKKAVVNAKTPTMKQMGRFHAIHTKKEKLDCTDCHGEGADDVLFLRLGESQGKEGPVNRKECLACHQTPKKPTFFGTAK